MIGRRFPKENFDNYIEEYNEAVNWCNSTQKGYIEDKGEYYEVVEIPPPSLDEVKSNKISELKSIRDNKEVEPIQTDKGLFDYDDKSRDRLAIARQSLEDNPSIESIMWTTAENTRVPLTIADFAKINSTAAIRSNELHIKYNELKEQVNACETVEEVEAIKW